MVNEMKREINKDPKLKLQYNVEQDRYLIAKKLKEIREAKGYTQKEIADITGLTQQMISKMEKYNTGDPSLSSFLAYCNALNINISNIICSKEV